jgi:Fe-S oxidoreductase
LYAAFKDALIQKNGILKVYWDDSEKTTREEYKKLTDDEFNLLVNDDEIKVSEHTEYLEELKTNKEMLLMKFHFTIVYYIKLFLMEK